jgi:DNA gyrase subunit A
VDQEPWLLREQLEIINGLIVAIEHWAEVSARILTSEDRSEARGELARPPLDFSPIQVEHILDMRAGQRTRKGREALTDERERLTRALAEATEDERP